MNAGIIVIGYELLSGETIDTNSQFLSVKLGGLGISVIRKIIVPDSKQDIFQAIDIQMRDCDLILISGGLGPTNDDITKKTLAEYFECDLVMNKEALTTIETLLKPRYPVLSEMHKSQALLPAKAQALKNTRGTASGILFEEKDKILIAMPGVPFELKGIFEEEVIPYLKSKTDGIVLIQKNIKTIGIAESLIAEKIKDVENSLPKNVSLAYLPNIGQVKIRLTGKGNNRKEITKQVDDISKQIEMRLEKYIYGYNNESIESAIGKLLIVRHASLSIAESCTGGYLSHLITTVPGSSEYFKGSVIAYSNEVKVQKLGVNPEIIKKYGAVSRQCAEAMVSGILKKYQTTYALSTTGIAGPGGGTDDKPVGTVWIACADKNGNIKSFQFLIDRGRLQNIRYSAVSALNLLRKVILKND